MITLWCNGSTRGFDPLCLGSNPSRVAKSYSGWMAKLNASFLIIMIGHTPDQSTGRLGDEVTNRLWSCGIEAVEV